MVIRSQNGQKKLSQIFHYDKYGKYDGMRSKINYKFRSILNLPTDLNEKYTAKFYLSENPHLVITFQLNSMIFYQQTKNQLLVPRHSC